MDAGSDARANYTLIRDLPASDRPRERLQTEGAQALSVAELLAIILRTGSARRSAINLAHDLLREFGGLDGIARAPFAELCTKHGLGPAKASQLLAALELGHRLKRTDDRPVFSDPEQIAERLVGQMSLLEQEHVRLLVLDARNRLITERDVYQGSVHTAQIRIGELLRDAVKANGASVVVVHNHPSGDPSPSAADIQMTKQLVEAGRLLDIDVHDHIVVGGGKWMSMRRAGLGFPRDKDKAQ